MMPVPAGLMLSRSIRSAITRHVSMSPNGRLPGTPPSPVTHSAQTQVNSHQYGQYECIRQPHCAVVQVSDHKQRGNRPDERRHEAAEGNQPTQPWRVVVLAELRLLPLPLGNLFIRAILLPGQKR
jgi:hypothetical protein